jgi:hypothetical protein
MKRQGASARFGQGHLLGAALRLGAALAVIATIAGPPASLAERIENPAGSTARITSPEGFQRVLVAIDFPDIPDRASLGNVALRIPGQDLVALESLDVFFGALSTPWSPATVEWSRGWTTPGGDIDPELRGRLSIEGESTGDVFLDLSSILRAERNGRMVHGLLLSVPEGRGIGFDALTAEILEDALSRSTLEVTARANPGERVLFHPEGFVPPEED